VNDDLQFFSEYPTTVPDAARVGFLPLNDGMSSDGTVSTLHPGARCQLHWCPAVKGDNTEPIATRIALEGLNLFGTVQAPIQVGRCLDLSLRRVRSTLASQGLSNFPCGVSYPVHLEDCEIGGFDAAIVCSDWMMDTSRLQIPSAGRDAIRLYGGGGGHRSLKVWRVAPWTDTVVRATGSDDGMSLAFNGFVLDNEGGDQPTTAIFHITQGAFQTGSLSLDRVYPSTVPTSCALVHLVGRGLNPPFFPYQLTLVRPGVANLHGSLVRAVGLGWSGSIDRTLAPGAVVGDAGALAVTPGPIVPR